MAGMQSGVGVVDDSTSIAWYRDRTRYGGSPRGGRDRLARALGVQSPLQSIIRVGGYAGIALDRLERED
jgi:hypothetical protein